MFKLLDIIPRVKEDVAFKVPKLNLENVNFLRDKFNIKYFSVNSMVYLEYVDVSRLVTPDVSFVVLNITNKQTKIIEIFKNEEEFLEVYNVKNINIIKE